MLFYLDLGRDIVYKQENAKWGSGFIEQLSKDLKEEFPEMSGFSFSNLKYCRQFYLFYGKNVIRQQLVDELQDTDNQLNEIAKQVASQLENQLLSILSGHHIMFFQKIKNVPEAIFYINQTIENAWERSVLVAPILKRPSRQL